MNRDELLTRIRDTCFNDEDIFSLDEWSSLTLPELRTVVALLEDGGAEIIANAAPRTRASTRGSCFLLEGLARWVRSNPTNPRTREPLTDRQRALIASAYRRLTGQDLQVRSSGSEVRSYVSGPVWRGRWRVPVARRHNQSTRPAPRNLAIPIPLPNPTRPNEIPDTEPLPAPRAPRVSSSMPRFFPRTAATATNSAGATREAAPTTFHLNTNGRTLINVNGRQLTADAGATVSITRSRSNGRDAYTITIQYPSSS